jgi:hypothetical protein
MIRRSFLGQEAKQMLSDHKPDPYRKLRRKPKLAESRDPNATRVDWAGAASFSVQLVIGGPRPFSRLLALVAE